MRSLASLEWYDWLFVGVNLLILVKSLRSIGRTYKRAVESGLLVSLRCRLRRCREWQLVEIYSAIELERNAIETGKGFAWSPPYIETTARGKGRCVRCGRLTVAEFTSRRWKGASKR